MASITSFVDTKIGNQVRAIREAHGLKDKEVADHLEIFIDEYKDLERGLKRFSATQLRQLSSLMTVNVATFFNTLDCDESLEGQSRVGNVFQYKPQADRTTI